MYHDHGSLRLRFPLIHLNNPDATNQMFDVFSYVMPNGLNERNNDHKLYNGMV